ncbi:MULTISPECIES: DUF4190 domain-containing protein [unclassified Streptomyces]|uniref:DUF4190 domain-containing protein n=1 Tax=unclassified Streptomyces TaxID=2593676 RepID=UPI00035D6381|nr:MULTISPECIES: DUF4190 domain-containing protein [unclassified Streptomyces]MYT32643.1 DUF4190 domain-containing protein [Streptomyces sp. SID8354]
MTTPTPPDGSTTADRQTPEHDPWAPPSPDAVDVPRPATPPAAYPAAYPVPTGRPNNGMGITALILGLVGVVLSVLIFLFWLSWLPAVLAVIFGAVGMSQARKGRATNKAMALSGLVLGIVGLLITAGSAVFAVVMVKHVVDDARAKVKQEKAAEASAAAEEEKRHLSFGAAYTFGNGLKVTISKPAPFTPDAYANGHAKGNKAVEITVTVVNTGSRPADVETGIPNVKDADGDSAQLVIDGSGRQKVITDAVPPGKTAVGKYAFSLRPEAAEQVEVEFSPDALKWDDAYWSGPTP